jgi:hypothetical protein
VRKPGRAGGDFVEAEDLVASLAVAFRGVRDPHRRPARAIGVAGDALVGDVELVAVTVEQLPQRVARGVALRVGIAHILGQPDHRSPRPIQRPTAYDRLFLSLQIQNTIHYIE